MTCVSSIFFLIDFIERIDNFMETNLPFSKFLFYMVLKIPFIFVQLLPISVLLSILIVFGLMNKHNEIVSLKSSGVSIYYLLKPFLWFGLCSTLVMFLVSELVMPVTTGQSNYIWYNEIKKKKSISSKETNIWIKNEKSISYISYFNQSTQVLHDMIFYFFDDDFNLVRRIDAGKGQFVENKNNFLELRNIVQQDLESDMKNFQVSHPAKLLIKPGFEKEDLTGAVKKSDELNLIEIYKYIKKIESEGYDANNYKVDFYGKIAFPFVCFILSIFGPGMVTKINNRSGHGLAGSIVSGMGITFLYWTMHSISISLGYTGSIPPIISAWITNVAFLSFGGVMLLSVE